ncbi:MAG: serine/threonine protein kinase [Myxococcales bacterium]|nr:serine/threonine protein kinase [Myxococcales bacterium]
MTTTGARGTPSGASGASQAAQERVRRHQHAAEVLRARSVLVAACTLWLVCGAGLDVLTHAQIGSGSLAFILIIRFATTVFHVAMVAPLFRSPLPDPKVAFALASAVFPVTTIALTLIATHQGGLTSPYVTAVFVIVMGQTIAWPMPWRQGALWAAISSLLYPIGLVVASRFDPLIDAQLHDGTSLAVFAVHTAVVWAGAIVAVWGGHVTWSLRQSVFESRKLGRYRLLRRIGRGGMGEVWRAEDRALRRSVALKILSPEHGRKPSRVARFEREIQATAAISHPNVVRIHDWGVTDDGVWYYAMDLLGGTDLGSAVKRCGPMPPALAVELFAPAARGLGEAHRMGVIHRDIKPGNMFVVAPDREPVRLELLDFGIARIGDDAELTQAGAVMGTPGFMAPEVVAGAPGNVRSDVYGLGAALYYALTGKNPRDAGKAPASAVVSGIPIELDDILARALDDEPSRRFESADDVAIALSKTGLVWTGSWPIDRELSMAPTTERDPTVDPDESATQSEAPRRRSRPSVASQRGDGDDGDDGAPVTSDEAPRSRSRST